MKKQGHEGLIVEDCGCIVSLYDRYLGASPDGRVRDSSSDQTNGILEIKCSYTKRILTPNQACEDPSNIKWQITAKIVSPLLLSSTVTVVRLYCQSV